MEVKRRKKRKNVGKKIGIISGILAGVLLISVLALILIIVYFYKKVDYKPREEDYTILAETNTFIEDVTNPEETTLADSDQIVIDEYQSAVNEALGNLDLELPELSDVYNILLIGTDERGPNSGARSDTMMLVSINRQTKQIVGTSFLRDTYVKIPDKGFNKLNASYAYGGVELLFDTLEYNFSIYPERYITVNFESFIKVIDILGGIEISVEDYELYWVNQYIHASNLIVGDDEHSDYLEFANGSPQLLNGKQALAYARVRYVGNADFTRTERQRTVVTTVFEKIKNTDPATLMELLDEILPEVTTDVTLEEFFELISLIPEISEYEIVSHSIPNTDVGEFQYITIDGQSHLGLDFEVYIKYLYDTIYSTNVMKDE